MQKKFFLTISLLSAFCLTFACFNFVHADVSVDGKPNGKIEVTKLADINLSEFVITPLERNKFRLSFNVENKMDLQSDLMLGVELFRRDAGSDKIISLDQTSFPSNLVTIGKDKVLQEKINYQAPEYLSGKAELWLKINDPSGINLALISAPVELRGDGKYLEFGNPCYLKVSNAASGIKTDDTYDLSQGVDISKEEGLNLVCSVKSTLDGAVSVKPKFEAHERDKFGREVAVEALEQADYQFAGGESREVTIPLPKPGNPQAYDMLVSLTTDTDVISNSVVAHFVLTGPSGTISLVSIDKDYYQKNDQAAFSMLVSGSADVFLGSRHTGTVVTDPEVSIDLKDGNNQSCGQTITLPALNFESMNKAIYPVSKNCFDPIVVIRLKDNENLLDERMLEVKSSGENKPDQAAVVQSENTSTKTNNSKWLTYLVVGVALLFIAAIIFIFWKRKKCNISPNVPLVFLLGIFFGHQAMAATLLVNEVGLYQRQQLAVNKISIVNIKECEDRDPSGYAKQLNDCRSGGSEPIVEATGDADPGDTVNDQKGYLSCPSNSTDFVCGLNETVVTVGTTKSQYEKSDLSDNVVLVSSVSGMRANNNAVAVTLLDSAPYIGNAKYDSSGSCAAGSYEKFSSTTDVQLLAKQQSQMTSDRTKTYDNDRFQCNNNELRYMLNFHYADWDTLCTSSVFNIKCPTFSCHGNQPALPQMKCPDTRESGLPTADFSWHSIGDSESLCTQGGSCEYYTSLEKKYGCTGILPIEPQKKCPNTKETDLPVEVPWTNVGNKPNDCTFGGGVCEFYGEMMYNCQGEMPAAPQVKCPNTKELGLPSEVRWHNVGNSAAGCTSQGQCEYYAP